MAEQIYGTLIAGSNLTIENSAGTVNINSTGMTISKMDLTMISDNEDKRLYLNPNVGILLQAKVGGTFVDRLAMDSSGNMTMTGSLTTGTGASAVRADTNGLYIGSPSFATAPFSVTPGGQVTASNVAITGGTMAIGSRFSVAADGTLRATNAILSGDIIANSLTAGAFINTPVITGGTLTGSVIQTRASGNYPRAAMSAIGDLFEVQTTATKNLKIYTYTDSTFNAPIIRLTDGYKNGSISFSDGLFELATVDGSIRMYAGQDIYVSSPEIRFITDDLKWGSLKIAT